VLPLLALHLERKAESIPIITDAESVITDAESVITDAEIKSVVTSRSLLTKKTVTEAVRPLLNDDLLPLVVMAVMVMVVMVTVVFVMMVFATAHAHLADDDV